MTTEALVFLGELDPEAMGPSIEFATHYEPTPLADIERLLDALPISPEGAAFVDIGSGMGRVVMLAARRPFRQVIGVEISPALHEVARANLARYDDPRRICRDIRLIRADAAAYEFPAGDLVVYLYNPFRATVLAPIVERLTNGPGREVVIVYHTPLERDVIVESGRFEETLDLVFAAIYRRKR